MNGLVNWIARRRVARIVLVALLFALPLLAVVSAALVIVTTITSSARVALQDCAAALLLLAVLAATLGAGVTGIALGAGVTWLVAIGLGELKKMGSLTLAVQSCVLGGAACVLGFFAWSRDPSAYWEEVLRDFTGRAGAAGIDVGPADLIPGAAQMMTGMMSASAVASAVVALFLGSWCATGADGRAAGQFAAEFQSVRMGRIIGVLAGIVGVLFLTALRATADDLILVLAAGFIVQGLSVVHWHGARRGWPRAWPLALYLPLALVPALAAVELLLLALLGLADNGFGLRRGRQVV